MESKRKLRHSRRRAVWPLVLATVGAFVLVGTTATPAQADSNFERGFEDQMGRILAYEAVNLGKHVLFQGVFQPYPGHGDHHRYSRHDDQRRHGRHFTRYDRGRGPSHDHWKRYDADAWRHYRHERRHDRHERRHYRRYTRHHRHDRHCRHQVSHHDAY